MTLNERGLIDLKQKIADKRAERDRLVGQKEHLQKRLSDEWKCASVTVAEKQLTKMKKEMEVLEDEIDGKLAEISEKYPV